VLAPGGVPAAGGRRPIAPRVYNRRNTPSRRIAIASQQELSAFLAEVERRAFKQAFFAVRDEDAALDIVQDAMLNLTEK
jgi:DNA-directed RNA polymerase specialized sigma24 family protein